MESDNSQKRKPRKSGRAPKELTPEFVFACGKLFCTQEEIGDLCGLSQGAISGRLNGDPVLLQAFRTGRAQGKMSLRRAQAKKAITEGNLVAQIWLGKQELGQSDKQESHEQIDVNVSVSYIAAWGKTPQQIAASDNQDLHVPDSPDMVDSTAEDVTDDDPPLDPPPPDQ